MTRCQRVAREGGGFIGVEAKPFRGAKRERRVVGSGLIGHQVARLHYRTVVRDGGTDY
ncbi:hypothetical protein M430DRAFT_36178 [Amorphotheca resinae ATCC 22711]|uniref:Uncharacterized protein n=1 Tax=Amorphotheca resinae ATCC 22711 TaxID=857342 RepID=A0A2T3AWD0_AMORE|nr:hypothetical protein M430DRAFT_36178 [Amorphotheca resinae ATCC 22711]PSS12971.1 hypothetical protein M430DRAFT_36178 [Amorphotheca resinae ATCC 22711]